MKYRRDEQDNVILEQIHAILMANFDRWITGLELAEMIGLTLAQIRRQIMLKSQERSRYPFVSSPLGYCYTHDPDKIARYSGGRKKTMKTVWINLRNRVLFAQLEDLPLNEARVIMKSFDRFLEDLDDLQLIGGNGNDEI